MPSDDPGRLRCLQRLRAVVQRVERRQAHAGEVLPADLAAVQLPRERLLALAEAIYRQGE